MNGTHIANDYARSARVAGHRARRAVRRHRGARPGLALAARATGRTGAVRPGRGAAVGGGDGAIAAAARAGTAAEAAAAALDGGGASAATPRQRRRAVPALAGPGAAQRPARPAGRRTAPRPDVPPHGHLSAARHRVRRAVRARPPAIRTRICAPSTAPDYLTPPPVAQRRTPRRRTLRYLMTLPNLVLAGFPKCGTTSVAETLVRHPDVCGAFPHLRTRHFTAAALRPGCRAAVDRGLRAALQPLGR